MRNKRRIRLGIGPAGRFTFVRIVLALMILSFLTHAYFSLQVFQEETTRAYVNLAPYFMFQINYVGIMVIFIITLVWILHYGFGALSRMENILEQIIQGDYSFRMHLRKRDIMRPFADKLNKVLDILEEGKKRNVS